MKQITVFTGAGISAESGISTFRDISKGLWYNYKVEDVATLDGWNEDPSKSLEFHNMLRKKIYEVEPNDAHDALHDLEEHAQVNIVTQNIDDLHERAKSSNIIHLHGELLKCRSTADPELIYDCRGSINIGDKCEKGSQLRPHTVLFGEYPYGVEESCYRIEKCDYLLIIGTSLSIDYTIRMLGEVNKSAKIYYIDPNPMKYLDSYGLKIEYIKSNATDGVRMIVNNIIDEIRIEEYEL